MPKKDKKKKDRRELPKFPCLVDGCESEYATNGYMGHLIQTHAELRKEERSKLNTDFMSIARANAHTIDDYNYDYDGDNMEPETGAKKKVDNIGERAKVAGELRTILRNINNATTKQKQELEPEHNQIREFISVLRSPKVSPDIVNEIEDKLEIDIKPRIEEVIIEKPEEEKKAAAGAPSSALMVAKAKLNSAVRGYMKKIRLLSAEKQEELIGEPVLLADISQKMGDPDLTIEEVERQMHNFNNLIKPAVDGIAERRDGEVPRITFEDDFGDSASSKLREIKERQKIMKAELEMKEIQMKHDEMTDRLERKQEAQIKLLESQAEAARQPKNPMVPKMTPMIDQATGQPKVGPDGNYLMEVQYVPQNMAGGGTDGTMQILMTLVTKLIPENRNQGPDIEKIMLKMENDNIKARQELVQMIHANNQPNAQVEEMRRHNEALIHEQSKLTQQFYQYQLEDEKRRHAEDTQRLNYYQTRNPLDQVREAQQTLMEVGLANNPNATAEEKAIETTEKMATKFIDTIDKGLAGVGEKFVGPLVSQQAALAQRMSQQQQPPQMQRATMSDEEHLTKLQYLLHNLEDEE